MAAPYAVWHGMAAKEDDGNVAVLQSPSVEVRDADSFNLATLYEDRQGNTALTNPFTGGSSGDIEFYTDSVRVNVTATADGDSVQWSNEPTGTAQEYHVGTAAGEIPTNAQIGAYVPAITESATDDAYTVSAGRAIGTDETFTGDVGSANTTTTPTLDNTDGADGALTVTTRDGSALWAGALSGVHRFEKKASSWLVLDPKPDTSATANSPVQRDASAGIVVEDVQASSINGGPLAGFRNAIINGQFDIWQRGTSATDPIGYATADRWSTTVQVSDGGAGTVSRQKFAEGQSAVSGQPSYFLRFAQTTATTTAGEYPAIYQRVEGVRTFNGERVVLSFDMKADAALSVRVRTVQVFGSGTNASANVATLHESALGIGTGWQRYIVIADIPSISGKTIDGGDDFLHVNIQLPDQATYTIDIANVQMERGSVATPFERRPIATELGLCQRYYWRLVETDYEAFASCMFNSSTEVRAPILFRRVLRGVPTVSVSAPGDLAVNAAGGTVVGGTFTAANVGAEGFYLLLSNANWTLSAGDAGSVRFNPNVTGGYLEVDAEL